LHPFLVLQFLGEEGITSTPRLTGVRSYDVSPDTQIVTVFAESSLSYEVVLRTIKKTGKAVISGEVHREVKGIGLAE
jgi:hypothetical protein